MMKNLMDNPNCIMCGKMIKGASEKIVSRIEGKNYVFDNRDCEIFFMKFKSVYGENFNP